MEYRFPDTAEIFKHCISKTIENYCKNFLLIAVSNTVRIKFIRQEYAFNVVVPVGRPIP